MDSEGQDSAISSKIVNSATQTNGGGSLSNGESAKGENNVHCLYYVSSYNVPSPIKEPYSFLVE